MNRCSAITASCRLQKKKEYSRWSDTKVKIVRIPSTASVVLTFFFASLFGSICLAQQSWTKPTTDDDEINEVMNDPRTYWYNERNIPPAYQFASPPDTVNSSVHSSYYNISGDRSEPTGHGFEFPWRVPGGTENVPSGTFTSIKFIHLPAGKPIALYRRRVLKRADLGYAIHWGWTFPVDSVVGEIHLVRDPEQNRWWPYEIRIRKRESDDWGVDILRPLTSVEDFRDAGLAGPYRTRDSVGYDARHGGRAINVKGSSYRIGRSTPGMVRTVLASNEFRSVLGTGFSYTQSVQEFGITPAGYNPGILGTDRRSCSRCHQDAGKHVDNFVAQRDWYGAIRGSDGILSFHPFSRDSISGNGARRPVRFNQELVRRGMIATYNPSEHTDDDYIQLAGYSAVERGDPVANRPRRPSRAFQAQRISPTQRPDPYPQEPPTIEIDYERIVDILIEKMALDGRFRGPPGEAGRPGTAGVAGPQGVPGPPGQIDTSQLPPLRFELFDAAGRMYDARNFRLGDTIRLQLAPTP
jgi:hypothetical protein